MDRAMFQRSMCDGLIMLFSCYKGSSSIEVPLRILCVAGVLVCSKLKSKLGREAGKVLV